jgi:hypothetical protein
MGRGDEKIWKRFTELAVVRIYRPGSPWDLHNTGLPLAPYPKD